MVAQRRWKNWQLEFAAGRQEIDVLFPDGRFERGAFLIEVGNKLAQAYWIQHRPGQLMGADFRSLFDDCNIDFAELRCSGASGRFVVFRYQVSEVKRTRKVCRPGPHQQDIHFQRFAFDGHDWFLVSGSWFTVPPCRLLAARAVRRIDSRFGHQNRTRNQERETRELSQLFSFALAISAARAGTNSNTVTTTPHT